MEHNRWKIKELLERKIGRKKSKIDWSLDIVYFLEWYWCNGSSYVRQIHFDFGR